MLRLLKVLLSTSLAVEHLQSFFFLHCFIVQVRSFSPFYTVVGSDTHRELCH